jgi:hypothetical protein
LSEVNADFGLKSGLKRDYESSICEGFSARPVATERLSDLAVNGFEGAHGLLSREREKGVGKCDFTV